MRVRGGDACAFESLFNRYQRPLLNFFHGLSRNPCTARDLAQETFLRVWKIRKRYRASGSFPAYLFGVARMIWLESCRQEQKTWRLGARQGEESLGHLEAEITECPAWQASRSELHGHLYAALEELPEEQRMVFVMRSIDGLSLITGMTLRTMPRLRAPAARSRSIASPCPRIRWYTAASEAPGSVRPGAKYPEQ